MKSYHYYDVIKKWNSFFPAFSQNQDIILLFCSSKTKLNQFLWQIFGKKWSNIFFLFVITYPKFWVFFRDNWQREIMIYRHVYRHVFYIFQLKNVQKIFSLLKNCFFPNSERRAYMKLSRNTSLGVKRDNIIKLGTMSTHLSFWLCNHNRFDISMQSVKDNTFQIPRNKRREWILAPLPMENMNFSSYVK